MSRALLLLPTLLAFIAEAAWISVLAALLSTFSFTDPAVGMAGLLVVVVAGAVAARALAPRVGERWPATAAGLAVAAGAVGWLVAPEVRAVLATQGPAGAGEALLANPGGWMAAVAFVRGIAQSRVPSDPHAVGTMLGLGVPGLAVAAILGGMVADPWRDRFLDDAAGAVLVFLVAGILALALGRLTVVGAGSGVDWRRNPAWVLLLLTLVGGVALASVSASVVVGPVIVTLLGAVIPTLLLIGFVASFDRRSLRTLALSIGIALIMAAVLSSIDEWPTIKLELPAIGDAAANDQVPTSQVATGVLVVLVLLAAVVTLVLVRLWMRRPRAPEDDLLETRWIDHGELSDRPHAGRRRRGLRFGRPTPADAVSAYRALIEDLAPRPHVRREPGETPAEHAARLRHAGIGALSLDLLAADYGLVRFGGMTLTPTEDRRAVRRADVLRRALTGPVPGAAAGERTVRTGDEPGRSPRTSDQPPRGWA